MLENFILSVGIVVPIFLVMFLGYFLRCKEITNDAFVQKGNFLVFKVILPANLFLTVYNQNVGEIIDIPFILFTVTATIIAFGTSWLGAHFFMKDRGAIGAFVHSAFRGNFVILGLPVMTNFLGAENIGKAALVILFTIPLYNVLAILVLSVTGESDKKVSPKTVLKGIATNPLTVGIMLGFIMSMARTFFDFPNLPLPISGTIGILEDTVASVTRMTTPLALICLGGGLELSKYNPKIKYGVWAAALKTIFQPLVLVSAAYLFGFRDNDLAIILITFAVPAAITSYTMTVQMGGDHYVGATSVMFSTLFSVFTLTGFIYAFMMLGLV